MPAGDRSKLAACAALITAALMTPALAQKQYGPGVTDTEIKIGTTTPYSGPASAYAAGQRAQDQLYQPR
jgi:branched-chain amino acid transport system substrate-binding protein